MKRTLRVIFIAALTLMLASAAWATNVTFQVNMSYQQTLGNFDPLTKQVVVRGSFQGWCCETHVLTDQGGGIYAGTWDIPEGHIWFKYVIVPGENWEWDPNREADVGTEPLVIAVDWFNRVSPPAGYVNVETLFCCDMTAQIQSGNFDPLTDWVVVRGNHANIGNWGGATRLFPQVGNPDVYELLVQFTSLPLNNAIEFKYVILPDGVGPDNWESTGNHSFNPSGTDPDFLPPPSGNGFQEIYPGCPYFSDILPGSFSTHPINLVFQVNISSIWARLIAQGSFTVNGQFIDNIGSFQVAGYLNGWSWGAFAPEYFLHNDGLNGDAVAGDNVWSGTIVYPTGSPLELIYKYGCIQLDAEAGFAMNHSVMVDNNQTTFVLPVDCFGSQDNFYAGFPCTDEVLPVELVSFTAISGDNSVTLNWSTASETDNASFEVIRDGDVVATVPAAHAAHTYQWVDNRVSNGMEYRYDLVSVSTNNERVVLSTGVNATPNATSANVTAYALHGNYPNPFNPNTNIVFDMKEAGNVSLMVYNLLGQKVADLVNGTVEAGSHSISFDATNLPSGLYIYKMETNGFSAQNKMMLLK